MGTAGEQAKSGLWLAFAIVSGFAVLVVLINGMHRITNYPQAGWAIGAVMVATAVLALYLTVDRWAKWFFAFCCANVVRGLIILGLGRTISAPSVSAPRIEIVEITLILVVLAILTGRFWSLRPDRFDSVCLVGAVAGLSSFSRIGVLLAVGALAVSFAHRALPMKFGSKPDP